MTLNHPLTSGQAMTADLHAQLVAAVTARRELAQAATSGEWYLHEEPMDERHPETSPTMFWIRSRTCGAVTMNLEEGGVCIERASDENGRADGEHIAFNNPSQILRDTEAHLKILDDHKPLRVTYWPTVMCGRCPAFGAKAIEDPLGSAVPWTPNEAWPCPTIAALAGIYPEVTEQ